MVLKVVTVLQDNQVAISSVITENFISTLIVLCLSQVKYDWNIEGESEMPGP